MGYWSLLLRKGHRRSARVGSSQCRQLVVAALEERCVPTADLWTQRGGDAGHTSYVDVSFNPATLTQAWNQPLGYTQSGTGSWSERAVAIDETHVYRTDLEGYAFNGTYHVFAYDLQTGAQVWHCTLIGNAFEGVGEPSVAGGIVYVNRAGHSGISGGTDADWPRIYGFDAQTGSTVLELKYHAQWGSNERPVIADNQLVVEDGYYGGISAYTASTMTRKWFQARSAAYDAPFAALDDEFAYAFNNESYRRDTGARLPNITGPTGLTWVADPMVSDSGRVFYEVRDAEHFSTAWGLSAFDGNTHTPIWTFNTPVAPNAKAVGNGIVAVTAGPTLYLLNEADGSLIRSWQAPNNLTSEIILTRTHAFVQSSSFGLAKVHAIDLSTGQEVWTYTNDGVMEMAMGGDHLLLSHHMFVRAFTAGAENQPPSAADDSATTNEDTPVTIAVLANDTDPEGSALTVILVDPPAHGSALVNADGTVTYTPAANFSGTDTFTYKVSDGLQDSNLATVTITMSAVQDPPVANAGPDQTADEAAAVAFDGGGSLDVDGDPLTYTWDFGDGGTGTGATPTHAYADNGTFTATLTVDDGHGNTDTDTQVVTVNNVAPAAGVSGPTSGVRGQARTFTFTATDASPVDQAGTFTYVIDWGDGSAAQTVQGPASIQLDHVFTITGSIAVTVTATDKDGSEGPPASMVISIQTAEMQGNTLVVSGTLDNDTIVIKPVDLRRNLSVTVNGVDQGTFRPTGQIIVYAQAGDDTVRMESARTKGFNVFVRVPAILFGESGNDTVNTLGSRADNVLVGGDGDDSLSSGTWRDILVGGLGVDMLRGAGGSDLLIAGATDFDANVSALSSFRAEWGRRGLGYQGRINHLTGATPGGRNGTNLLTPATVHDDASVDQLTGEAGADWFLYH